MKDEKFIDLSSNSFINIISSALSLEFAIPRELTSPLLRKIIDNWEFVESAHVSGFNVKEIMTYLHSKEVINDDR